MFFNEGQMDKGTDMQTGRRVRKENIYTFVGKKGRGNRLSAFGKPGRGAGDGKRGGREGG